MQLLGICINTLLNRDRLLQQAPNEPRIKLIKGCFVLNSREVEIATTYTHPSSSWELK